MPTEKDKAMTLDDVAKPVEEAASSAPTSDDLPDKYRGKSITDIVKMHQEAEKLVGRQAQEVGELRKLADDYIKANLKPESREEEPDFFVDPKKAVKATLEQDPLVKETVDRTKKLEARLNQQALEKAHPDYEEVISSDDFQKWVVESKYRTQLFNDANANWDFDAANELFTLWKSLNKANVDTEKATRKAELKRGSVPSGGPATDAGETTRKIYRRADIITLMKTDPKRYQALQPEIMKAYSEGRVR